MRGEKKVKKGGQLLRLIWKRHTCDRLRWDFIMDTLRHDLRLSGNPSSLIMKCIPSASMHAGDLEW